MTCSCLASSSDAVAILKRLLPRALRALIVPSPQQRPSRKASTTGRGAVITGRGTRLLAAPRVIPQTVDSQCTSSSDEMLIEQHEPSALGYSLASIEKSSRHNAWMSSRTRRSPLVIHRAVSVSDPSATM